MEYHQQHLQGRIENHLLLLELFSLYASQQYIVLFRTQSGQTNIYMYNHWTRLVDWNGSSMNIVKVKWQKLYAYCESRKAIH